MRERERNTKDREMIQSQDFSQKEKISLCLLRILNKNKLERKMAEEKKRPKRGGKLWYYLQST
jgi:hypothetical protein